MTGQLPSLYRIDPVAHGRQLRSNYVYNAHWTPFDFSDLLSLIWRCDQAYAHDQQELAAYYRAGWESLLNALGLCDAELGQWLLKSKPPLMQSIPAFVEREAPFTEDWWGRAKVVTNLFKLRESILAFGVEEAGSWLEREQVDFVQSKTLNNLIDEFYGELLPAKIDDLAALLSNIDDILHAMLLPWHPRRSEKLPNLIAHYEFPDPSAYIDKFEF
ncbi:MAG: hypothetical protein JXB47_06265 [Anaerolineae bacterium]|nr:hypothetical protein [Anaerolineae bacterium]